MVKDILIYPDPGLFDECSPVDPLNFPTLEQDLRDTLAHAGGYAIAAPQIGVSVRAILIRDKMFWNPTISMSEGQQDGQEGCLSLPYVYETIQRPNRVIVRHEVFDRASRWRIQVENATLEGVDARAACHEIEHLDGVLLTSGLSAARVAHIRTAYKQARRKAKKQGVSISDYFYAKTAAMRL